MGQTRVPRWFRPKSRPLFCIVPRRTRANRQKRGRLVAGSFPDTAGMVGFPGGAEAPVVRNCAHCLMPPVESHSSGQQMLADCPLEAAAEPDRMSHTSTSSHHPLFSLCGLFVSPLLCSSQRVKEGKVMSGPPGFYCVLALCHCIACRPQTHVQGTFLYSLAQQLPGNSTLTSFKSMQMLSKQRPQNNVIADISYKCGSALRRLKEDFQKVLLCVVSFFSLS